MSSIDKSLFSLVNPLVLMIPHLMELVRLAVPNAASFIAMHVGPVSTVVFMSGLDDPAALAAIGLGSLVSNVLGFSIGIGLTSVLDTLVSQAIGSGNHESALVALNRARIVSCIVSIPAFIILRSTESILTLLGQESETARLAGVYVSWSAMGLLPSFLFFSLAAYLRAARYPTPPLIVNSICSVLHVILAAVFILMFRWSLFGAGVAVAVTAWSRWIMLEAHVSNTMHVSSCIAFVQVFGSAQARQGVFNGMRGFLAQAVPSAILMWSEWWAYEAQALIAGWISVPALAANVVCSNMVTVTYMIPMGLAQAAATVVGSSLGAGKPESARYSAVLAVALTLAVMVSLALLVLSFRESLLSLYGDDVREPLGQALTVVAGFCIVDGLQGVLEGILRGMRMQQVAVKFKLIAMLAIRLPLGFLFGLLFGGGVSGLWLGAVIGMSFSSSVYLARIIKADFSACAIEAVRNGCEGLLGTAELGAEAPAEMESPSEFVLLAQGHS